MDTEIAPRVRSWASILDENTAEQAARTARLPIVHSHVALMPDAHLGIGATVGSVVPTEGAIIPAAVGVDIGCGMAAVRVPMHVEELGDEIGRLLDAIAERIPAGVGKGHEPRNGNAPADAWFAAHPSPTPFSEKDSGDAHRQFGTLGAGNHFVEVCGDEDGRVWLMLHSGSRGIGNRLAQRWISRAREIEFASPLEDRDLAYFVEGTDDFRGYVADMLWAQDYAAANRTAMLDGLVGALVSVYPYLAGRTAEETINCHHNYAARETHDGVDLWVTRKGAIRAGLGELGIIPGSMGARSYIVRGLGNAASFESCSHGAGRVMSRKRAKRELSAESLAEAMGGRTWQAGSAEELVDEHPSAYKPIEQVMDDQRDLVEVVATLSQVLNYKGVA